MALLFICNGHTAQTQNIINEMGEWLIYGSNGTQKATVKKLEYSGEFMGETSVTCDIYSPSPISFSIGDYLVYRGERFTIDYDATRLKQARNNTYGKGYTYENMRFLSYVGELKKCEFLDFVPSDNLIHFSQLPDFSFYAETVKDLADRLQANLDRIYTGSNAWSVQVVQGFEGKENINVSVSKATCFDALRMAYDQFEATFIIRGRTITIGTAGNELETDFKYGKGNGLKTIERSVDESDSLVTRLRAYGNTTNLPANYYKNIGMRVYAPIYEIYHVSTTGCDIHFVPKLKNACFSDKNGQYSYWVTVSLDETLWLKAVASPNNHLSSTAYSVVTVGLYGSNTQAQVTQFLQQLQSGTYDNLYFKQGINVGAWPVEYREYAENVPNLMAIDRLMLPGFPELTTDPYIDASNISTLGVREKSVYFDGSDPDTPDIHPTLEGMTAAELRAAGYTIELDAGDNGNLDEIAADATETDGSPITADGAFEGVDEVPGFKVSIKDIGFDINDYLSTETATLVMKTGMCGGREFTIVNVEKVGNKYVLECQRTEDVSHYFPYNPYLIKAGDKFVLTNIEMPKAYIDAASQRLLAAAQAYIAKYSAPQWVYAIKMDDIWMQRQRDNSVSEASSYYWNIKEGDVMNVTDSDLGVDISEVIDRLTIREGYGPIPEFEVVLRKEKPQGTIGVLQNRIRQLELRNAEQVDIIRRQQNYLTFIFGDTLADVMSQLDKKAETWYQANDPSSAWTNDEDKAEHVGDLWMDISANGGKKTYIYQNTGTSDSPNYQWVEQYVPDEVFDEIDGKAEIFVEKPTAYHERDMWIIENGISSSDLPTGCVAGDIVISSTDSTSFNKAHWSKKDRYTDDSSLNAFISGTYADDLEEIQNQIDGKAETWYQNTDPSTAWTTTALKNQHKGDIWHNSSTSTINGVKAGQDAIWNGTAWVVDETVPQAIYDEIDGKCAIYVSWGAWGNDLQEKDLFIPAADTTQDGITYKANKVYRCVDKDTPTFQEIAYTDDTQYNGFITKLIGSSGQTKDAAENAIAAIKHALSDGNTYNEGGLILSNLISLGTGNPLSGTFTPWAGISGIYKTSETGTGYKGHGIAAWFGGGMVDGEVSQSATNAAKSLFRFDGSGYVAGGNLSWDKNGNVTIQGYSINATTLQVGGSNVATESSISTFFANFFDIYNGSTQITYEQYVALQDKSNVSLKAKYGLWTEQFLSALGLNSQGGGGGGTGSVNSIKIASNTYLDPDSDGIIDMSSYAANWNDAYNKRHTHSNKSVLDEITSTKVSNWDAVYGVVPSAAYESGNQLADKNFVNSSISTATATYISNNGVPFNSLAELQAYTGQHDKNDYAFVKTTDSAGNTLYNRYKFDGTSWSLEYTLNNSSFTADQWSAINSGITSTLVSKLNGIAAGAQVNVLESVKINDTALSISSKAVNIVTGNGLQSSSNTISVLLPSNSGLSVASTGLKLDVVNNLTTSSDYRAISATQAKKIWDLLNQMFTLEGAGTTASPYVIKANYGLYSEQFLSALGQNSQGGSGGGDFDEEQMWAALQSTSGTYATTKIATSHIPDMASTYGYLKSSALNGYATQSWVNQQGFLTTHQSIYTLTLKAGGTAVTTFTPNSADASLDFVAGTNISLTRGTNQITIANTYSYTLPLAASGTRGGVQIGYSETNSGTSTTRNYAVKLSSEKMYVNVPWTDTTYKLTLNGTTNGASGGTSLGSFYAPTASGTANQVLISGGSNTAPSWTAQSNLSVGTAAKLGTGTTTYTAWGQTYWSSGVPQSISGNMTSVGSITPSANGNALGTTSARFNIYGTSGNFSGNVSISGTLGVTGATTLSSTLSVAGGITLTTTKKIYFGDTSHYLELDSTGFHFSHGVYSDSFVSALGANSSGGGSGDFDEEAMWEALGTTSTAKVIASSHIPNLSASKITSGTLAAARIPDLSGRYYALYGGTPLTGTSSSHYDLNGLLTVGSYYCSSNTTSQYIDNKPTNDNWAFRVWVSATTGTSSTYVRQRFQYYIGVAAYERYSIDSGSTWTGWALIQATLANYALASSLNNYLPLSGGTLTGVLTIATGADRKLIIDNTDTETKDSLISFRQDGTEYGTLGTWGNDNLLWKGNTLLHTANYNSYAPTLTGTGASGTWGISVSGNATTATTLQTPRTIWGQSFDGSGNVSGQMSNVGHIYPASTGSYNIGSRTNYFNSLFGINITLVDNTTDEDMVLTWKSVTVGGSSERVFTMYAYETKYSDIILGQSGSIAGGGIFYDASADSVGIGTYTPAYKLDVNGTIRGTNIISSVATGTAPLTVASSTVVSNLNADLLDGQHASYFASAASLSNYVTLATAQTIGGAKTFTNGVTISSVADNKIIIDNTDSETNYSIISFRQNGTQYGWVGTTGTTDLRWTGNILLHAGNYNSYAPSLTGTGASGTWGISISGTAAQANQVYDYQSGNGAFFASCQRGIGSTNTGALVYAYGSNPIRFYTNNTEKMRIAAAGDVGIGTDSPSYKLHVYGQVGITAGNSGTIRLVSANSINYIQSGNDAMDGNVDMIISGYAASTGTNLTLNFNTVNVTNVLKVKSNFFLGYGAEGIYLNGTGIYWHNASNAWTKTIMTFASTGATTINGNLTVLGEVTATSDERKKNIISNTKFNVKDIASARSVLFEWNDGRDDDMEKKIHGGSIAQDWLGKADSFLSQDNDGWYSLNYGALALCSAITIAREVVKHEDRITLLEKENARLKARVAELEERRVA